MANANTELSTTAEQLLRTAERLLAEKGLGVVSTREIAREAGQKNHSALSYHFGSMESLIEAILDYRMMPLNQRRATLLAQAREQGGTPEFRVLVEIIVQPFASELLRPLEESYYISLLSQLIGRGDWQAPFTSEHRSSAILEAADFLRAQLSDHLGDELAVERLRLMGLHVLNTIAQWNAMRRRGEIKLDEESLQWRMTNLVDYLVGALQADTAVADSTVD